jgi:DnaJ-class molecular chaperone
MPSNQVRISNWPDEPMQECVKCPRCNGRGYHHGFGERGHDPDWCEQCDGAQYIWRVLLTAFDT